MSSSQQPPSPAPLWTSRHSEAQDLRSVHYANGSDPDNSAGRFSVSACQSLGGTLTSGDMLCACCMPASQLSDELQARKPNTAAAAAG